MFRGDADVGCRHFDIHHVGHDGKRLAVVVFVPFRDGIGPIDVGPQGVDTGSDLPRSGDGSGFGCAQVHCRFMNQHPSSGGVPVKDFHFGGGVLGT